MSFQKSLSSSDGNNFEVVCNSGRNLSVKFLNSSSVFVLECKGDCIYVWQGRSCTDADRFAAIKFAEVVSPLR